MCDLTSGIPLQQKSDLPGTSAMRVRADRCAQREFCRSWSQSRPECATIKAARCSFYRRFSQQLACDSLSRAIRWASEGAMATPVTRYAKSGDVHIAYQV